MTLVSVDPYEYDRRLRVALFAHVQSIADASGGVVSGDQLASGFTFAGERIPIYSRQRGIFRPKQLREVGAALTIQTSYNGPYADEAGSDEGIFFYKYQGDDPTRWDNVALRRAGELRIPVLYLYALKPGLYRALWPIFVDGDDPSTLTFMLRADAASELSAPLSTFAPERLELQRRYRAAAVKQRLHQEQFRVLVLDAYREQCAMCRLKHLAQLDAAHIIADADPRGVAAVSNGLSLCKIHHSAFDVNILGVDQDYIVHVRQDVLAETDGPMLLHGLQEMQGQKLAVPRTQRLKPDRDRLAERFEHFVAA
jgi:putative restriction endonuclease